MTLACTVRLFLLRLPSDSLLKDRRRGFLVSADFMVYSLSRKPRKTAQQGSSKPVAECSDLLDAPL